MKRILSLVLLLAMSLVLVSVPAMAESTPQPTPGINVQVDLGKISAEARNEIIGLMNGDTVGTANNGVSVVEQALANPGKVAKYMNEFAVGLKEVCTVLSIEVNEFVKTPVGAVTTGVVLYKVLDGSSLISYLKELIALGILSIIGWLGYCRLFKIFYLGRTVKIKYVDDAGKKAYRYEQREPKYNTIGTSDAKMGINVLMFALFVGLVILTGLAVI